MADCNNESTIRRLIAYKMANDETTNPEGLSVDYFIDLLSTVTITEELKKQWLADSVEIPTNTVNNSYTAKQYD